MGQALVPEGRDGELDTYTTLTDSQRLHAPLVPYSIFQGREPKVVKIAQPPISSMWYRNLDTIGASHALKRCPEMILQRFRNGVQVLVRNDSD